MTIQNFDQLLNEARKRGPKRVALAVSQDEAALAAIVEAKKMGIADALLFGDRERTLSLLNNFGGDGLFEIHHFGDEVSATKEAVSAIREKKADILLKGKIHTSTFLRCVLNRDDGLRTERLLSDVFIFEDLRRKGNQLVIITDGGITPAPTLEQKVEILQNAVQVANQLGNDNPKVAVLSAVETVTPAMPSTIDAALIAKMNERGQITGCIVDGPLALDNAVSAGAAKTKSLVSKVAGDAEILVCPNIESANLLAKGTTYFAGFRLAHIIVGATAPVLIPSRADTADAKLLSIALGVLAG
jgi:phosphate butyryltransferase